MQKSWFLNENCGLHTLDKLTEWDHCHRDCVEISCRTSVLSVASLFLFFRPNAHTRTMTSTRGEKDFQKEASGKRTKFLDIYLKYMTSNLYSVSYVYVIKQYLLWCLAEGHASKCWRQGFSVHLTARALRQSCSDLLGIISSFQATFFHIWPKTVY